MRTLPAFFVAAALVAVAAPATAFAAPTSTGVEHVSDFQFYVLGNSTLNGNNISDRAAVGGNATFVGTSISGATSANPSSLVVGGDLTYSQSGGSIAGNALVGGANNSPVYLPVSSNQASLPIDFTAENLRLKNLSATLGATAATGTAESKWGGLFLTGSNSDLNVFTISASMLSQTSWFSVDIAQGSQVLINVTGDNVNLSGGLNFYTSSNILWNFVQATSITAGNLSLGGTVLAPLATFQGNGGSIGGDLIVGNFNGSISLSGGYGGNLLNAPAAPVVVPPPVTSNLFPGAGVGPGGMVAVPEPTTWALLIMGFGAIGAVLRRRRGLGALATRA